MRFEQEPNEGHPDCHGILWSFRVNLRINRTNRTVCKKSAYISYQQKPKKRTYTENPWNPLLIYALFCWPDVLFRGFESGPVLAREPLRHSPSNSPFWDPPNDDGDTRHRSGNEKKKTAGSKNGWKRCRLRYRGFAAGEVDLADDALPGGAGPWFLRVGNAHGESDSVSSILNPLLLTNSNCKKTSYNLDDHETLRKISHAVPGPPS